MGDDHHQSTVPNTIPTFLILTIPDQKKMKNKEILPVVKSEEGRDQQPGTRQRYLCPVCCALYNTSEAAKSCHPSQPPIPQAVAGQHTSASLTSPLIIHLCEGCSTHYRTKEEATRCQSQHLGKQGGSGAEGEVGMEMEPVCQLTEEPRKHGSLWQDSEVDALVRQIKEKYPRLTGKAERRHVVWHDIAIALAPMCPGVTASQCRVKWKHIKDAFIKYENRRKSGSGKQLKTPISYNVIYSFLGERPAVVPTISPPSPPPQHPMQDNNKESMPETDTPQHTQPAPRRQKPLPTPERTGLIMQQGIEQNKLHYKRIESQNERLLEQNERLLILQETSNELLRQRNQIMLERNVFLEKLNNSSNSQ